MVVAALRQLLAWGVPNIEQTLRQITGQIERDASRLGLNAVPDTYRAGHIVGLDMQGIHAENLAARLAAANVFVSLRGSAMRVSPHLYNTPEDIGRLLEVLEEAL